MRSLLMCLAMAGTVCLGSVKLMARERARKGEERREGVEALAGREVFFLKEIIFYDEYLAGRGGRAGWSRRLRFLTLNMRMITNQVILTI